MGAVDENSIEISITNDVCEIAGVAARIDEFCETREIGRKIANAVNVSIDEILTNTIGYGYDDDEPHRIEIALSKEADALVIAITDDSKEFDPSGPPPEVDFDATLEDRALGGLGLFLVHELMDRVDYRRVEGRNLVTLTKNLAGAD
jgi:anti-sigma regulatory factor (Ser/Thr protein kinase)